MCKLLHPDRETGHCEQFKTLKNVYSVLINPINRARYDTDGTILEKTDTFIVTENTLKKCREQYAGECE